MLARRDSRAGIRRGQGQENRNLSALADRPAVNDDFAAVISHDSPTFRQAKSEPAAGLSPAEKRVKNVLPNLIGNAGPVVAHHDSDLVLPTNRSIAKCDFDVTAFVTRFNCIFHNRMDRNAKLGRIAIYLGWLK